MPMIRPCRCWPRERPIRAADALFEIERSINGRSPEERLQVRQTLSRPLVEGLQVYMREQLPLARGHDLTKAFNYIPKRWASFTLFLEDGRVCLSNNAAERGLRGIALGRKSCLFCGSDRGGRRAAAMYSLIGENERHRPAVAYGYPRADRRPSGSSAGRTSAMELDAGTLSARAA